MYKYAIGQDQYDCYSQVEVLHHKEYSEYEFINLCKQALSKLGYKDRKEICDSYGDYGAYLIGDVLVKEFGFIKPDKVKSNIHIRDLFSDKHYYYISCEECPKSYELNGKIQCIYDECERREFLKEKFE